MKKEVLHIKYFSQHFHNIVHQAFFFFFTSSSTPILVVLFLSFLLNIDMCMYSYTELTNSYTFTTLFIRLLFFFFFFFFTNYNMPVLVVLFLSFLLNIYMCMYSYIELTNPYNIFTIIDNLHCSLALFFLQYTIFACTFKYYMCIHNYTDAT